jgi:hypothetical protein
MASGKNKESKSGRVPEKLAVYLSQMEADDRALLEAIFQTALLEAHEIEVLDLWDHKEFPVSYWILLLTGVNQEEEMVIASALLSWQAFFAKHSARLLCIQSSERNEFRCCSSFFEIVNYPALIFSDSPDMENFVKIEPELLFNLATQKGGLQRFLAKLHSLIENTDTLSEIRAKLLTEKFWSALKIVYSEVKSFVSFSAKKEL